MLRNLIFACDFMKASMHTKTIFFGFVKLRYGVHDKVGSLESKERDFLKMNLRLSFLMD